LNVRSKEANVTFKTMYLSIALLRHPILCHFTHSYTLNFEIKENILVYGIDHIKLLLN